MSDSLVVIHRQAYTKGNIPSAAGANPDLVLADGKDTLVTMSGASMVMLPIFKQHPVPVAGYYLQVEGADGYYTTKVIVESYPTYDIGAFFKGGNQSDTALVAILPANFPAGTFNVKYAAYDGSNNISNTATATVVVYNPRDSINNAFQGFSAMWYKDSAYSFTNGQQVIRDVYAGNQDTVRQRFACGPDGKLVPSTNPTDSLYDTYQPSMNPDYLLLQGNSFSYYHAKDSNILVIDSSSCGHPVYHSGWEAAGLNGHFLLAPSRKQVIFVNTGWENQVYNIFIYDIDELRANRLRLKNHYTGLYTSFHR